MGMTEVEKLIEIYRQLEKAGLMVTAGKKSAAELMVSHDVVPVVRCCDCQHCVTFQKEADSEVILTCYCHSLEIVDPTDYCSKGERKDND